MERFIYITLGLHQNPSFLRRRRNKEITFQCQLEVEKLRVFGSSMLDLPQVEACSYYILLFDRMRNKFHWKKAWFLILYLQLTLSVTVVSRLWPSGIARFHTRQRYLAPSSSRCGVIDRVLVVGRSFEPPRLIGACNGIELPSRYQLFA